ncbi:WW domain-binding protein 1-like isoform X1 [Ascaphus truei]|uniref:WW domain-binding protein 1-like isoform X1 n=1 Tax=Ascaphus truei TaxID=8439 RepID=UPI003F5A3B89
MRREELELGVRGSVYGREFCFGEDRKPYRCEIGYCCGDTECCTYYYELWWFWLAWTLIIMAGCCCAYRHRRVKLRHQQEQRQREISLMAYQGVAPSQTALEPWLSCKLPSYDEVTQQPPTPPPPYCETLGGPTMGEECSPFNGTTSTCLNLACLERGCLTEAQGPSSFSTAAMGRTQPWEATTSPPQSHHGDLEEGGVSSERRRHITGDSGIEVCEQEEEAVSQSVRGEGCKSGEEETGAKGDQRVGRGWGGVKLLEGEHLSERMTNS